MIVLFVVLWVIMASICAGIMMYLFQDDWSYERDAMINSLLCLVFWPVLLTMLMLLAILKIITVVPKFIAGIFNGMKKEKEKKDGNKGGKE